LSKGDSLLGNPIHQAAASGGGNLTSFAGAETTIKHAGGAIEHIKFVFEKSICEEFGKITNPLFQKMVFNNFQIQTLSTLRDLLLPKLMKGELRVKI
jgi:hypothetical protein